MKKTIVICASVSFYKQVIEFRDRLQKKGFKVIVPKLAEVMEQSGDYNFENHKKNYPGKDFDKGKRDAIKRHFKKIEKADLLLVLNYDKKGIKGYIGGNVLMEMGLAFYLGKPIYILNKTIREHSLSDEIFAMQPVFLDGELENIK